MLMMLLLLQIYMVIWTQLLKGSIDFSSIIDENQYSSRKESRKQIQ